METFYAVTDGSDQYILATREDAERAKAEESQGLDGDDLALSVVEVQMTRAQFEALPEFNGF